MANHYQKEVHLFIKSVEEVAAMASSVPFAPAPDLHCYVFVAEDGLAEALMSNFRSITPIKNERGAVSHDIFYWQVPKRLDARGRFFESTQPKRPQRQAHKSQYQYD